MKDQTEDTKPGYVNIVAAGRSGKTRLVNDLLARRRALADGQWTLCAGRWTNDSDVWLGKLSRHDSITFLVACPFLWMERNTPRGMSRGKNRRPLRLFIQLEAHLWNELVLCGNSIRFFIIRG